MDAKLIGLYSSGPQQGKTTAANYLRDKYGYQIVKFAEPIKSMLSVLLLRLNYSAGAIQAMLDGDEKEQVISCLGQSARQLMQSLGTEWGRKLVHDHVWLTVAMEQIADFRSRNVPVVIDDMRFHNEFHMIADGFHGVTARIVRTGATSESTHASEGALDSHPFDFTLIAKDGIENVHANVDSMMYKLGVKP